MPDSLAEAANAVREEGRSTWAAYYKHARGFDSLRPLSHRGVNDWGSVGMMAIDCLDTLWLMNLTAEFKQARSIVEEIDYTPAGREARSVSTFEMTIRGLGGLLSAHALSGDRLFLRKAEQLGEALNTAFVPGRFPLPSVSLKKPGAGMHGGGGVNPAEVGTLSLEFHSLARATKRPEFDAGPDDVRRRMAATVTLINSSLVPLSLKSSGGAHPTGRVSLGAMGDSYYEYLAKTAILDPRLRPTAGAMFKAALLEIEQQLLVPREHGRTFLAEASMNGRRGRPAGGASAAGAPRAPSDKPLFSKILKMDHLACFLPGPPRSDA